MEIKTTKSSFQIVSPLLTCYNLSMFKTKLWGFLLVSLFLFLSSYLVIDLVRADDSGLKIPKFDPDKYSLLTPTLQDISQTINLAGSISADKIASVKFQTSGQ